MPIVPDDIESQLKKALREHLGKETPSNLREAIGYSLLAPGKRIRPRLVLASAAMLELPEEKVLPAALALEMIHCFTLIHDDLPCMDDDDFRRGLPSNHRKFGEALALLAGDALIPLAIETFCELEGKVPSERFLPALQRLLWASGPRGVIGGQAAEPLLRPDSDLAELSRIFAQKTGALFSASILIPMDLAGIAEDSEQGLAIALFARELGFAFQVADDLEDDPQGKAADPAAASATASAEKHRPTSILHYLTREEAQAMTARRLITATESLDTLWRKKAKELVQISNEVRRKLETA